MDQQDEVAGTVLAHLSQRDNDDKGNSADTPGQPIAKQPKQDADIVLMNFEVSNAYHVISPL